MSDGFSPWDPQGLRPSGQGEDQGPDPDPIVRRVRLFFVLAGMLAGALFQRLIAKAVRLAVDDPELRAAYGSN